MQRATVPRIRRLAATPCLLIALGWGPALAAQQPGTVEPILGVQGLATEAVHSSEDAAGEATAQSAAPKSVPEPVVNREPAAAPEPAILAVEKPATAAIEPGAPEESAGMNTEPAKPSTSGLPRAPNLPLDEPVASEPAPLAAPPVPAPLQELVMLGREVSPKTSTRLAWAPTQSFEGIYVDTPVLVVNGVETGPTLCLTAAMHGDELNGIETVRRVLYNLDAAKLKGAVIGVPIVNLQGFHAGSRYLTDRRDLNRYFPGDPRGSSASRLAHSFFHEVIAHCDALVDLHTGSFYRTNLPQLRGDLRDPRVVQLTKGFGSTVVVHSEGTAGTLRRAAVEVGIPAVTLEAGGPSVLSEDAVSHSVKGIRTLLNHLGMTTRFSLWGDPEPIYYNSVWERAPVGGIVFSRVTLGQSVKKGDVLGTVTNPITNVRSRITSNHNGRIIGMALNQVVQPGFATHHIGITPPKGQISPPEEVVATDPGESLTIPVPTVSAPLNTSEEAAESELPTTAVEETHSSGPELGDDDTSDEDLEED